MSTRTVFQGEVISRTVKIHHRFRNVSVELEPFGRVFRPFGLVGRFALGFAFGVGHGVVKWRVSS